MDPANEISVTKEELRNLAFSSAEAEGIDPWLFLAQMEVENRPWDTYVPANSEGAVGPAQLVPTWHPQTGYNQGFWPEGKSLDFNNPDEAYEYASKWVDHMVDTAMKGGVSQAEAYRQALSTYNAGSDSIDGAIYARDVYRNLDSVRERFGDQITPREFNPMDFVSQDPATTVDEQAGFIDTLKHHMQNAAQPGPTLEPGGSLSNLIQIDPEARTRGEFTWGNKLQDWGWITPETLPLYLAQLAEFHKRTPETMQAGQISLPTPFQVSQLPSSQPQTGFRNFTPPVG